jgi:hypothetical protein
MQKLLATSAIAMIALSGAAFAQQVTQAPADDQPVANATNIDADFTVVNDNTNIDNGPSLLTQILSTATEVQVNMLNAAENLANLDGSINVLESANVDELLAELTASTDFGSTGEPEYTWRVNDGTEVSGSFEDYQAAVNAVADESTVALVSSDGTTYNWTVDGVADSGTLSEYNDAVAAAANDDAITLIEVVQGDNFAGLLKGVSRTVDQTTAIDFFDPAATVDALQTDVSNLTTTVIGALNTGIIGQNGGDNGIAANTLAMANMELESVAQTTGSLANSAQYFDPGNLQLANLATNMATVVDASVNIDQLMANVDTVATTLIGALNTGDIATDVNQNASNLTQALVGQ